MRRNLTITHQLRLPRHPGKDQALIINGDHRVPFRPQTPAECMHTLFTDAAKAQFAPVSDLRSY
jgi:hypothetical protein